MLLYTNSTGSTPHHVRMYAARLNAFPTDCPHSCDLGGAGRFSILTSKAAGPQQLVFFGTRKVTSRPVFNTKVALPQPANGWDAQLPAQ